MSSSQQESANRELLLNKFSIVTGTPLDRVRVMMADKNDAEVKDAMAKVQNGEASVRDGGIEYSGTR